MFSKLPSTCNIRDYLVDNLPVRQGIWKVRRPFRVLTRLFDGSDLVGYILYDRRSKHCFPVSRATFIRIAKDRQIKQVRFGWNGIACTGDLVLECLPYHQVKIRRGA